MAIKVTLTEEHRAVSTAVLVAYMQDRMKQYRFGSCCRMAIETVAYEMCKGEAWEAYDHGELDDLLSIARKEEGG